MNGNSNVAQRSTPIVLQLSVVREGHFDLPRVSVLWGEREGERERHIGKQKEREMTSGQKEVHAFICPPLVQTSTPLRGRRCVCVRAMYMCVN